MEVIDRLKNKKVGNRLKKLRLSRGLSQKEMADILKVTRPLISMYEAGNRMPSPNIMKKYSIIFKKSVDDIFFR
ncbi:transcriptional regulator, XRE family [Anaerococcus prevotii DSM 20548]|uniref:Transcriptional regulator, XRE family n=1 Tax=Anaerococcus prevotii (strain ATCC 9321 / DSM 20548 / JCM 6508 / NCTC 11806 / PC1) TaxID=525919 RepID=C7RH65_ANAPD|nr:transcriptional regulator, XRE family [Anaerococcus prevotii DSM 20548]